MKQLSFIGVILFAVGGSLEASPDASAVIQAVPYILTAAGALIAVSAALIDKYFHLGGWDDDF